MTGKQPSAAYRRSQATDHIKAQGPRDLRGPSAFVPARLCLVVDDLNGEIDGAGVSSGGGLSVDG